MIIDAPDFSALLETHQRISPYIHQTPVLRSTLVDQACGAQVFFKCENLQRMGAFKMRGAANAMLCLSEEAQRKGVTTHSSGNFAQAVALAARELGIKATIVMPENAPWVKKAAVLDYGAAVIDCAPTLAAREATCEEVVQKTGATALHPYDDWHTIAGQATAAMEFMQQQEDLDIITTPVGGGGLIAGTALAAHYFQPELKVIGAEPAGADDAYQSLKSGVLQPQTSPNTVADGLRTSLGKRPFAVLTEHLDDIVTVEEGEIVAAMRMVWERMKILVEPSSSVPVAAIRKYPELFAGKRIGVIISGGNVDLSSLPF